MAFVVVERRTATPLVRLGILRSAPLPRANAGAMLLVGSFMAFQFTVDGHRVGHGERGFSCVEPEIIGMPRTR